jgi:hypothetical protein
MLGGGGGVLQAPGAAESQGAAKWAAQYILYRKYLMLCAKRILNY